MLRKFESLRWKKLKAITRFKLSIINKLVIHAECNLFRKMVQQTLANKNMLGGFFLDYLGTENGKNY